MKKPDYVEAKPETVAVADENVAVMAKRLRDAKDKKDELEEALTGTNKEIDELSKKLAERLESDGVDSIRVPDVGTVYIQIKNRPNVTDQDGLHMYLRENGHGAMIKETIHPMTLIGFVNERLKNNEELPPSINNFQQKLAVIRRK